MAGNSFATPDGPHVTGAVAMALDAKGQAIPIEADTPIGTVKVEGVPTLEQLCRALAAHAALIAGKDGPDEAAAALILSFARKAAS